MSGLYLIVWDNEQKDILRTTKGGYPHLTVAYTGKAFTKEELLKIAQEVFPKLALTHLVCTRAYISSFEMRHDVLLEVANNDLIIEARTVHFQDAITRPLHITHGTYWTLAEAKVIADQINTLLPHTVQIIGITIK